MLIQSDARHIPLKSGIVQCCVTSPPYFGLRNYGVPGQIGLECTIQDYLNSILDVSREIWRILRDNGTFWINIGDSYTSGGRAIWRSGASENKGQNIQNDMPRPAQPSGLKPKDLIGIPWRVAFALQADGWYLRSDIIWAKPNPMPESVTDRPTKAHEYIFLLTKSERYYWDQGAVREPNTRDWTNDGGSMYHPERFPEGSAQRKGGNNPPQFNINGRNLRTVWTIATQPYSGSHFATFPRKLVETCLLAGSKPGDVVFDPFVGSGTVVMMARDLGRVGIGCDLAYQELSKERIYGPLFADTINI